MLLEFLVGLEAEKAQLAAAAAAAVENRPAVPLCRVHRASPTRMHCLPWEQRIHPWTWFRPVDILKAALVAVLAAASGSPRCGALERQPTAGAARVRRLHCAAHLRGAVARALAQAVRMDSWPLGLANPTMPR